MRLGILGGTFDPIHYGHLLLAEQCREQCRLQKVWFVPAAVPPHKQSRTPTEGRQRCEIIEAAIEENEAFELCRIELQRGGVSYTVDTLQEVRQQHPQYELFLILGGDSLEDFPHWHQPAEICRLATLVVAGRPGAPPVDFSGLTGFVSPERIERFEQHQIAMPLIEISSTDIRRRVAAGQSICYQTPEPVRQYVERHALYRG